MSWPYIVSQPLIGSRLLKIKSNGYNKILQRKEKILLKKFAEGSNKLNKFPFPTFRNPNFFAFLSLTLYSLHVFKNFFITRIISIHIFVFRIWIIFRLRPEGLYFACLGWWPLWPFSMAGKLITGNGSRKKNPPLMAGPTRGGVVKGRAIKD